MVTMVKDKNNSDKGSQGREPNEMLELLKTFYNPEEEIQDFSGFYSALEEKLDKNSPSNKIAASTEALENEYLERQQRLETFLRRMDETNFNPKDKLTKRSKSKTLVITSLVLLTALATIYFFKNFEVSKKKSITTPISSTLSNQAEN